MPVICWATEVARVPGVAFAGFTKLNAFGVLSTATVVVTKEPDTPPTVRVVVVEVEKLLEEVFQIVMVLLFQIVGNH